MVDYVRWAEEIIGKIRGKMDWVSDKNKDKIPYTTGADGSYDDRSDISREWNPDDGINWWTNGFWGGMMWLLYQDTGEKKYAEYARVSEYRLERSIYDYYGLHHDVGFMFQLTAVTDYRLTGNMRSGKTAMHVANLLAGRFNPAGNFIRAWNDWEKEDTRGWAIIDCLMNLPLLYFASEESKDPRFRNIAMSHAETVIQHFVRLDGSVEHIVEFDPETGKKVRCHGGQGFESGSAWTRGQGWAIYGFLISYIHTKKKKYLDVSRKVADYCIANIPKNGIIPVDFRQPEKPAWEDSCGACILACGLLELARQVSKTDGEVYREGALRILTAIADNRTDWGKGCDAIVQNCTAAYHDEKHHFTMVYADYFFMEAIYKLKGTSIFLW